MLNLCFCLLLLRFMYVASLDITIGNDITLKCITYNLLYIFKKTKKHSTNIYSFLVNYLTNTKHMLCDISGSTKREIPGFHILESTVILLCT